MQLCWVRKNKIMKRTITKERQYCITIETSIRRGTSNALYDKKYNISLYKKIEDKKILLKEHSLLKYKG